VTEKRRTCSFHTLWEAAIAVLSTCSEGHLPSKSSRIPKSMLYGKQMLSWWLMCSYAPLTLEIPRERCEYGFIFKVMRMYYENKKFHRKHKIEAWIPRNVCAWMLQDWSSLQDIPVRTLSWMLRVDRAVWIMWWHVDSCTLRLNYKSTVEFVYLRACKVCMLRCLRNVKMGSLPSWQR